MKKDFESGRNVNDSTGILERPYCECFVPINIDKWFDRITVKPEMNALLLQIYRKIGCMEGLAALMEYGEMQDINILRCQHREKFIFLKNTIWAMRKEFHPF